MVLHVGGVPLPSKMENFFDASSSSRFHFELLQGRLLMERLKVVMILWNQHLDFDIGYPPVDIIRVERRQVSDLWVTRG